MINNQNLVKSQLLKRLKNKKSTLILDDNNNCSKTVIKTDGKNYYTLSSAQKRMYLLHKMNTSSIEYNLPIAIEIKGNIDYKQLKNAFNKLVQRHECLRMRIDIVDDEMLQYIEENVDVHIEYYEEKEQNVLSAINKFCKPFNLNQAPLIRVGLIKISETQTILIIDTHHIISDGTSLQIILKDLLALYKNNKVLPNVKRQYHDYVIMQNKWLQSEEAKKQEKFWLDMYKDNIPVLDLHTDYPRNKMRVSKGDEIEFSIDDQKAQLLTNLSKKYNVSDYVTLMSIIYILLSKYTGQDDIVIGSPVAGRKNLQYQDVVGLFVNTLAIRNKVNEKLKYSDFLKDVGNNVFSALESQDYPFDLLVEKAYVDRDYNRNPFFDFMFSMLNMKKTSGYIEGISLDTYKFKRNISNFDLELYLLDKSSEMKFILEYNSSLFKKDSVKNLIKHFKNIINQIIKNDDIYISQIQLLDQDEMIQCFKRHRGKDIEENDKILNQLFEEQVLNFPDNIAVISGNNSITYRELDKLSNKVANKLLYLNDTKEEIVAIFLDRGISFLASMLGVFKSAKAYVPIDPNLNKARIKTILEESTCTEVIVDDKYNDVARELCNDKVNIILFEDLSCSTLENKPDIYVGPNNLAYIIFTSGSTGKPKGAMVEHKGMMNHILSKINDLKITNNDVIAETATQSFDVSVWQFLTALGVGGTTVIFEGVSAWQPRLLFDGLRKNKVTIFETVPSHIKEIIDEIEEKNITDYEFDALRILILNGELLLSEVCKHWFKFYPYISILNAYGPTECSDDVTHYWVQNETQLKYNTVPISGTIAGMRLYILDKNYNPVPKGVSGQLFIGGIGVGRGYLGDKEKTDSVFVKDIYSDDKYKVMYNSGDIVRELPSGEIVYIGRNDFQVKINGRRIEISEIEHTLLKTGLIKEVTVAVENRQNKKTKQIYAYLVLKQKKKLEDVKKMIKKELPSFMIPNYWIILDNMPLLLNGKIDRKRLPKIKNETENKIEYVKPEKGLQIKIAKLWKEVLEIKDEEIGLKHDFFQMGGSSIKAMRLVSKIQKALGFEIPFTTILAEPILENFVEAIKEWLNENNNTKQNIYESSKNEIKLLPEHKRIIRQAKSINNKITFNMPYHCKITGDFNIERAKKAYIDICNRHFIMNAIIDVNNDECLIMKKNSNPKYDVKTFITKEENIDDEWVRFIQPFPIKNCLLFRMEIHSVGDMCHFIFFDNHTIGSDFISKQLILKEFLSYYSGIKMKILDYNYDDYIKHRLKSIESSRKNKQEIYWNNIFSKDISRLHSSDSKLITNFRNDLADRINVQVDKSTSDLVFSLAKHLSISEHSIMMSIFTIAVSQVFSTDKFFLLSPVADRNLSKTEELVGLVFDTVPVLQTINVNNTIKDHLLITQNNLVNAYSNKEFAPIEIYEEKFKNDNGWNDGLFDATFVWVEVSDTIYDNPNFEIEELPLKEYKARYDFRLEAFKSDKGYRLNLEYRKSLFKHQTIEIIRDIIVNLINNIQNYLDKSIEMVRDLDE